MPSSLRLLWDSDLFCKLALADLLEPAADALGVALGECGRLPALPHMLRRGRLRTKLGADVCDRLVPRAESLPIAPAAAAHWLDLLVGLVAVDPGEAQLYAAAAEHEILLVSGDKRAMAAVAAIDALRHALEGRVVTIEAIMLALHDNLGSAELRRRAAPLAAHDTMVRACLGSGQDELRAALVAYLDHAVRELQPLRLWRP